MERAALLHLIHLPAVWLRVLVLLTGLACYTAFTLYVEQHLLKLDIEFPTGVHTLLGLVLGFLLVFRTNTSYDRWWEGRRLWGQLVNDTRTLSLRVRQMSEVPCAERHAFGLTLAAFGPALRDHLRGVDKVDDLPAFLPRPGHEVLNVPVYVAGLLYARLQSWRLEGVNWIFLDRQLAGLMDVLGGCERIRNTPLPVSHEALIRLCIVLYLLVLPIGLDYGPWSFPTVLVVGYFMLGVEQVAEDIQEPFGKRPDDLQLDKLCQTLANSVAAILPAEERETENAEVR